MTDFPKKEEPVLPEKTWPKVEKPVLPEKAESVFGEMGWSEPIKNVVASSLISAGFNLDEIDPEWLRTILHYVDKYLGDKIPDNVEELVAVVIASLVQIFADKKVTAQDIPVFKGLVEKGLDFFASQISEKKLAAIKKMIEGAFELLACELEPVLPA